MASRVRRCRSTSYIVSHNDIITKTLCTCGLFLPAPGHITPVADFCRLVAAAGAFDGRSPLAPFVRCDATLISRFRTCAALTAPRRFRFARDGHLGSAGSVPIVGALDGVGLRRKTKRGFSSMSHRQGVLSQRLWAEARFAQAANLSGLQLFAVRSKLPFEPVAPSRKRSVRQGRSPQMSATGVMR